MGQCDHATQQKGAIGVWQQAMQTTTNFRCAVQANAAVTPHQLFDRDSAPGDYTYFFRAPIYGTNKHIKNSLVIISGVQRLPLEPVVLPPLVNISNIPARGPDEATVDIHDARTPAHPASAGSDVVSAARHAPLRHGDQAPHRRLVEEAVLRKASAGCRVAALHPRSVVRVGALYVPLLVVLPVPGMDVEA